MSASMLQCFVSLTLMNKYGKVYREGSFLFILECLWYFWLCNKIVRLLAVCRCSVLCVYVV